MGSFIPAYKLIAEIESRMEDCKLPNGKFPTTTNIVRYEELSCLRNYITSLQQEQSEVDLDKEIEMFVSVKGLRTRVYIVKAVAHYFYELGLNARKEETK